MFDELSTPSLPHPRRMLVGGARVSRRGMRAAAVLTDAVLTTVGAFVVVGMLIARCAGG